MGRYLLSVDARYIHRSELRTLFSRKPGIASITEAINCQNLKSKLTTLPCDLVTDIAVLPRDCFVLLVSEPNREMLRTACGHGVHNIRYDAQLTRLADVRGKGVYKM